MVQTIRTTVAWKVDRKVGKAKSPTPIRITIGHLVNMIYKEAKGDSEQHLVTGEVVYMDEDFITVRNKEEKKSYDICKWQILDINYL